MYSEKDLCWIAGFLDGEGTIGITKHMKKYAMPYVEIGNTNKEIIYWIKDIFQIGCVYEQKPKINKHGVKSNKIYYRWKCSFVAAFKICLLLYPYLRTEKKQKAKRIIEYYESRGKKLQ